MPQSLSLTVSEAQKNLRVFSYPKIGESKTEVNPEKIRQSLHLVAQSSEYQILGICAESYDLAIEALNTYSMALGYEAPRDLNKIEGAVYLKFNPNTGLRYISPYEGNERGVLVSCQSPNSEGINEMYGHLPLDLFVSEALGE